MSAPDERWNPDDGPPPTDEERADAARLSEALARPAAPDDPALRELVAVAQRIHATAHPDRDAQRAVVDRVTREVLAAARPTASPVRALVRRAWPFAVAAAAVLVVGVSVGRAHPDRARPEASISRDVDDVLRTPVGPGAASAPAARVYDARLTAWREAYLRGGSR
jgi:hypothetical protein